MLRSLLFFSLLFLASTVQSQNNFTVSMGGIGGIKPGMTRPELEKALGIKLKLKRLLMPDNYEWDTVQVKHNGLNLELVLMPNYFDDSKKETLLREVKCRDARIKTKSGITLGNDRVKIVQTYPNLRILIVPGYEDKTRGTVFIYDEETSRQIIFHLKNGIIDAISVAVQDEGC